MMVGEWAYADRQWEPRLPADQLYVNFVEARHSIYKQRVAGLPAPWTTDPILQSRKYTNVFRILDRGSQFLCDVMRDSSFETALFQAFLYRYTNRPEPWVYFEELWGYFPTWQDAKDGTLLGVWQAYKDQGLPVFGNAYKMFVGQENKGLTRLDWAVGHAAQYATPEFAAAFRPLAEPWQRAKMLQTIPRCQQFMSMQILTDIGYYAGWDENLFIIPGPGAIAGAKALTTGWEEKPATVGDLIRTLTSYWQRKGTVTLAGRSPSLMDVQNTLCEFSKYVKQAPRANPYHPVGPQEPPLLPPHYEGLI